MNKRIVIAGAGIAGLSAAKAAREQDPDSSILLLEAGGQNTYTRTRLPEYISGDASLKELFPYDDAWYEKNRISFFKNTVVTGIDTEVQTVSTTNGIVEYDALVIASGSSGNIPPIPGVDKGNVFPVRTIADADRIRSLAGIGSSCTIIGGGLLGLEMAWAIRQLGCEVNVIDHNSRLLSKQIDEQGAALLSRAISQKGIKVYLNAQTREITGKGKAESVILNNGTAISTDFVILSTGVKANTQPFAASGIAIGRSIQVNNRMETSVKGIYAAGDVAEYEGKNFSIWPIALAHGKIAGHNAAGGEMCYTEIQPFTNLKIKGITMFSIGDISCKDCVAISELSLEHSRYIKFFLRNGVIIGSIVFGEASLPLRIKKAVEQKKIVAEKWESIGINDILANL